MRHNFDHEASVAGVRGYFDGFAEGEWARLDETLPGRVSFEVHRRFLTRFIEPGTRVLEIGAGPGRFTIALAEAGATVVTTDISPVQLSLNERYVREAGYSDRVERREIADTCDLSNYRDEEFDAVVAYGGPLSYAFDKAGEALREMLRVVPEGGPVVGSVMATLGAYRHLLPGVVSVIEAFGDDANERILATGDLREIQPPDAGHSCKMFRWPELEALIHAAGGQVLAASASNWASLGDPEALERLAADPDRWSRFLDYEAAFCAEPGIWEGSTHLLFATNKSPSVR